jgi:hypothetical protein
MFKKEYAKKRALHFDVYKLLRYYKTCVVKNMEEVNQFIKKKI